MIKLLKHSLVSQRSSEVLLDVRVHHRPEVVIFTVPEKVYNKHLRHREESSQVKCIYTAHLKQQEFTKVLYRT